MAPVLKALLDRLVEKNVAQEVGAKVIEAVGASLVGASLPTFGSLASTVKAAMAEALGRVLTPSRRVDLLHDISTA